LSCLTVGTSSRGCQWQVLCVLAKAFAVRQADQGNNRVSSRGVLHLGSPPVLFHDFVSLICRCCAHFQESCGLLLPNLMQELGALQIGRQPVHLLCHLGEDVELVGIFLCLALVVAQNGLGAPVNAVENLLVRRGRTLASPRWRGLVAPRPPATPGLEGGIVRQVARSLVEQLGVDLKDVPGVLCGLTEQRGSIIRNAVLKLAHLLPNGPLAVAGLGVPLVRHAKNAAKVGPSDLDEGRRPATPSKRQSKSTSARWRQCRARSSCRCPVCRRGRSTGLAGALPSRSAIGGFCVPTRRLARSTR